MNIMISILFSHSPSQQQCGRHTYELQWNNER